MSEQQERLTRVQLSNVLAREIANLAKPAPVARGAPMSDYAKREGLEPKPVRIPLIARLMA